MKVTEGDAQLTLTWEAPASWGTWEANGYDAQIQGGNIGTWTYFSGSNDFGVDITSLTAMGFIGSGVIANGTEYSFRVRAWSLKPNSDNTVANNFRHGAWVTVSGTPTPPTIEFQAASYTFTEGETSAVVSAEITAGTRPAQFFTVPISVVAGGAATRGTGASCGTGDDWISTGTLAHL